MLTLTQMLIRFGVALVLGGLVGLEREKVGKEAGARTAMLVSGGACIFTIVAISLPYLVSSSSEDVGRIISENSGYMAIIGNIIVGIGFLGGGIILKGEERVHNLTTAAAMWVTAAIGVLSGVGLVEFAVATSLIVTGLLYGLRKFDLEGRLRK